MIKGQDWSSYQSAQPSITGLDFVFVKISEGLNYINPRWVAQRDWVKKKGLVWGAYHYPHMANDPIAEANYFLKQVAWAPGDLIVLDWEGYDSANQGVSKARMLSYRDTWLSYVKGKMPNHRVGMYCNTDYWRNLDKTSNCGDFLWIATGGRDAGDPGISSHWTFHQYSDADGLDRDVANFNSRAALAAWAKGLTVVKEEEEMDPLEVWAYRGKKNLAGTGPETEDVYAHVRKTRAEVEALVKKVDNIAAGNIDYDTLADRVADKLATRLKS